MKSASNYQRELAKLDAAAARLESLVAQFDETRSALRDRNWHDAELTARCERLGADIDRERADAAPLLARLTAFHRDYWQRQVDQLLAEGAVVVDRIAEAHAIRVAVFGDRTPIENFAWSHFLSALAQAMGRVRLEVSDVPIERPALEVEQQRYYL